MEIPTYPPPQWRRVLPTWAARHTSKRQNRFLVPARITKNTHELKQPSTKLKPTEALSVARPPCLVSLGSQTKRTLPSFRPKPLAGRVVTGTGGRSCDGTNACPTIRAARAYAHAHILSRLQPKMLTGDRSFGHVKVSVGPIILVSV